MKLIIIGSSGHARAAIDILEKQRNWAIIGLVDDFRDPGSETLGYKVLGKCLDLPALLPRHDATGVFVAVGDNHRRAAIAAAAAKACPGLTFASAVHPSVSIGKGAVVMEGAMLMPGAVVGPAARVGRFCILNTHSSLDHDSVMGDFSSLAPGVNVGGASEIGPHSAIGIGAVISHGLKIGEHTVVGAGATVLDDLPALKVVHGTPAKPVRDRQAGEPYL